MNTLNFLDAMNDRIEVENLRCEIKEQSEKLSFDWVYSWTTESWHNLDTYREGDKGYSFDEAVAWDNKKYVDYPYKSGAIYFGESPINRSAKS